MIIDNLPFGISFDNLSVYGALDVWDGGVQGSASVRQSLVDIDTAIAQADQQSVAQMGSGFKDVVAAVIANVHANSLPDLQTTLTAFHALAQQQSQTLGAEAGEVQSAAVAAAAAVGQVADLLTDVRDSGGARQVLRALKTALGGIMRLSGVTGEALKKLGAASAVVGSAIDEFRFPLADIADRIDNLIAYEEFVPQIEFGPQIGPFGPPELPTAAR